MEFSKSYGLLLICMLFVSSATPILGCGFCGNPSPPPKSPITSPPTVTPPIKVPPVTLPPIVKQPPINVPPVTLPPIVKAPFKVPPVTLPPIVKPPETLPPVTLPLPVTVPPAVPPIISNPPSGSSPAKPCPPTASKDTCSIDTLKLGACVDLLGRLVHRGLGDLGNKCCPILQGLVEVEAAVCLCTTLKNKALNLNVYVPLALQLLITCGKTPPPGYTCFL